MIGKKTSDRFAKGRLGGYPAFSFGRKRAV